VTATGPTRYTETGAGVLVSASGQVMTAAHVVQTLDEITVEFLGGETVPARVVASEPAADLSLLQLERVPPGAKAARMADSSTAWVGDRVIVVGAPYGLSHSLSVGHISARWPANTVHPAMPLAEFFQTDADIILSVQGVPFTAANAQKIRDTLNQMAPGAPITVTILRAGDVLEPTGRAR
jgi:serine protease Do